MYITYIVWKLSIYKEEFGTLQEKHCHNINTRNKYKLTNSYNRLRLYNTDPKQIQSLFRILYKR